MPKVLVADDNKDMLETLDRIFSFYGFEVERATDGNTAVEKAKTTRPDLIVLDGMMPEMDGFEACRILKSHSSTSDIPIVFLTANYTDPEQRVIGLELGADDYMLKPFNSKELVARSKSIIKRAELLRLLKSDNEKLNTKNERIQEELKKLQEQSQSIEKDSFVDPITGLYSVSFFDRRLHEEFRRAQRYKKELSLVIVQINHLEKLAESFGQQLGNYILMKLANSLLTRTRSTDILSYAGNAQFYIILPETDQQGAFLEAERIRIALGSVDFTSDAMFETDILPKRKMNELNQISFNVGVASLPDKIEAEHADTQLISLAQQALKASIRQGVNKTVVIPYNQAAQET